MRISNSKARLKYNILDSLEAGVVLSGMEVKSIRASKVDLSEAFAKIQNGQVFLKNCYIYPLQNQVKDYDPRKDRKLLLHRSQIRTLMEKTSKAGVTLVPLSLYEKHNLIKVELAIGSSKKKYDHRKEIKEKDEQRKIDQELKGF